MTQNPLTLFVGSDGHMVTYGYSHYTRGRSFEGVESSVVSDCGDRGNGT